MENSEKQQIVNDLVAFVEIKGSQNKAAVALQVSSATVSQMLKNNWDNIADEMWRKVKSNMTNPTSQTEWQTVNTSDFNELTKILTDAQSNSMAMGVIGEAGSGKTVTMKHYAANNKNAFLLDCNEYWNRKLFLGELLKEMGFDYSGLTVGEMMNEAVSRLKSKELPLIMMNEADKLTDQVFYFFITLYNRLEDDCGIILIATDHLRKRLDRGRKLNKKGYNEIFSRIGRKFIELDGVTYADVHKICIANGITDVALIKKVWNDCESDLRRVKRKIHALKNTKNAD